jgi:hypothetical protein
MRTRKRNDVTPPTQRTRSQTASSSSTMTRRCCATEAARPPAALCQISPLDRRHGLAVARCERCGRSRHAAGFSPRPGHAAQRGDVAEAAGHRQRGQAGRRARKRSSTPFAASVFVEQKGESIIGELAEAFTNDPAATFCPVGAREEEGFRGQDFRPIPEDADPKDIS